MLIITKCSQNLAKVEINEHWIIREDFKEDTGFELFLKLLLGFG